MKVMLLYLHVVRSGYPEAAPPEYYTPFSQRFVDTYRQFAPGYEHELRVVCCGAEADETVRRMYAPVPHSLDVYTGAGSDIGACQDALSRTDADFVVCMSTPVYFWRAGWLERLVQARELYGEGLYGPMASNQNLPHIRTSCWAVSPKIFAQYPYLVDTREKCSWAESFGHESGMWQITQWHASRCLPTLMVTWQGEYGPVTWRKPDNIFRRGDQSNCIVWDQHVDVYRAAHYHERLSLSRKADGE